MAEFCLSKIAGKKYIWQKKYLEGVNLICFFAKNKSNLLPLKKSIQLTIYLMINFGMGIQIQNSSFKIIVPIKK